MCLFKPRKMASCSDSDVPGNLVGIACTGCYTYTIGKRLLEIARLGIVHRLVLCHEFRIIGVGEARTGAYVYLMTLCIQREPIYTRADMEIVVQMVMGECIAMS